MKPPDELDVLDRHGGFTRMLKTEQAEKRHEPHFHWVYVMKYTDTLWEPGYELDGLPKVGKLMPETVDEKSFYQLNDDVTRAWYKVEGYEHPIVAWFDNRTGLRIA